LSTIQTMVNIYNTTKKTTQPSLTTGMNACAHERFAVPASSVVPVKLTTLSNPPSLLLFPYI